MPQPTHTRAGSFGRIVLAYVVAIAAGAAWLVAGPSTGELLLDTLIADVIATLVIFGFSRAHRNSSFYDAYWSVVPALITLWWWVERDADASTARIALAGTVMFLWAVRLTANWARLWPGLHHEDWRYPMLRDRAPSLELVIDFFAIHFFPTLQVFAGLLPVYVVTRRSGDLIWLDWLALLIGLGAVLLQLVADGQMRRFTSTAGPGQVMDQGLWAWSRHPNYLGELLFWFSLALFGIAADPGAWWWCLVGIVAMLAMFLGASIPMMERRSLERRPSYQAVIDRVPMLLPRPPRRSDV